MIQQIKFLKSRKLSLRQISARLAKDGNPMSFIGVRKLLIGEGPNAEAETLSARMRSAWTTFAASGDPGWIAYDTRQRLVQLFDARPTVAPYPEDTSRQIWQDHAFPVLRLQTGR